jgi:hypothetical protein
MTSPEHDGAPQASEPANEISAEAVPASVQRGRGSDDDAAPSNPLLATLSAGSVFVRKSAGIPVSVQSSKTISISGWVWHAGIDETTFQTALKEAGWKWFYLGEVHTVKVFGQLTPGTVERLLEKALIAIHRHNPNTFTITAISAGSSFGFRKVSLSVQARHIQRGIPSNANRQ